jgi:general stress protein CsbA
MQNIGINTEYSNYLTGLGLGLILGGLFTRHTTDWWVIIPGVITFAAGGLIGTLVKRRKK